MGVYSVPESIRQLKFKGTMVNNISGHYYVYEYSNYTDENGKRHTKMGRSIGSIKEVCAGFSDLATCNQELTKEWDYESNGDLTP